MTFSSDTFRWLFLSTSLLTLIFFDPLFLTYHYIYPKSIGCGELQSSCTRFPLLIVLWGLIRCMFSICHTSVFIYDELSKREWVGYYRYIHQLTFPASSFSPLCRRLATHFVFQGTQLIWWTWLQTKTAEDNWFTLVEGYVTFVWSALFFQRMVLLAQHVQEQEQEQEQQLQKHTLDEIHNNDNDNMDSVALQSSSIVVDDKNCVPNPYQSLIEQGVLFDQKQNFTTIENNSEDVNRDEQGDYYMLQIV